MNYFGRRDELSDFFRRLVRGVLLSILAVSTVFFSACSASDKPETGDDGDGAAAGERIPDGSYGEIVSFGGMTYFIAGNWNEVAVFRVSGERGAVVEEAYVPREFGSEIPWLAVSGDRLYWAEGAWGRELWLMRSGDGFASVERVTRLGDYAGLRGVDDDALYIDDAFGGETGDAAEGVTDRITHDGNVTHIPIPDGLDGDLAFEIYRGFVYYAKYDPVSGSEDDEIRFWRGLFRKSVDGIIAAGGFEGAPEELVAEDFIMTDNPGDGFKGTTVFTGNKIYFSANEPYEPGDANIKEVDLASIAASSTVIDAPWNVPYDVDGEAILYFDWDGGTVNRTGVGGGTEKIAKIPEPEIYISDFKAIDSWLYMSDVYENRCVRLALDGSGFWEALYPPAQTKDFSSAADEESVNEALFFVTERDDRDVYVMGGPSADAERVSRVEPGDEGVLLRWLGLTEYREGHNWYGVLTPDGLTGWARDDDVRVAERNP